MIYACKEADDYEKKLKRSAKKSIKNTDDTKTKTNSFQEKLRAQNKILEQKRMED